MVILLPIIILIGIAIIETFIATLDVISIMRRRLLLNFVLVFSGAFLGLVVIRYVAQDPDNWVAMLSYSLAAAFTSVLTIHYDSVLRKKRRTKNLEKARQVKAEKALQFTGNVGECK